MQGLMKMLRDGRYDLKAFATDDKRANVTAYAVFSGTHTGQGGPPPTGKRTSSDYVYSMDSLARFLVPGVTHPPAEG
jgi:hypothetical protein